VLDGKATCAQGIQGAQGALDTCRRG
jgi:hypothetical protein